MRDSHDNCAGDADTNTDARVTAKKSCIAQAS